MKTHFIYRLIPFSLLLLLICFSCKKYTNNQEQYVITFESNVTIDKAMYRISRPEKGEFVEIETFETIITDGSLKPLTSYKHILDTTLVTDDIYGVTINYAFDIPTVDSVDALINVTMVRTERNEILFQKSFHEDHTSGVFTIKL